MVIVFDITVVVVGVMMVNVIVVVVGMARSGKWLKQKCELSRKQTQQRNTMKPPPIPSNKLVKDDPSDVLFGHARKLV